MNNRLAIGFAAALLSLTAPTNPCVQASQSDESSSRVPTSFTALEYLTGRWKGQGVPKNDPANAFRGWSETHSWSWVFKNGNPIALSLTVDGGHVLASGKLTFDPVRKLYRLEGTLPPPAAGAILLEGALDRTGKLLTLESVGKLPQYAGTIRLSIRPNANFIRYTIREDRREPAAFQFKPFIEVGLTKEGESFASGATAAARARCIITGAASTMSVTYQGTSYPVCCTGCRDEFLENPEKYIKKASLMQKAEASKPNSAKAAASRVTRFEDAFASDVSEDEAKSDAPAQGRPAAEPAKKTGASKAAASTSSGKAAPERKSAMAKQGTKATSNDAARAASLLRIGQNLEKNGGRAAAVSYYRRIVKEYPATPAAKSAAERIKAIGGRAN